MNALAEFDHPAWLTAAGTLAGYGLILVVMFALLFVVPYLVYAIPFGPSVRRLSQRPGTGR